MVQPKINQCDLLFFLGNNFRAVTCPEEWHGRRPVGKAGMAGDCRNATAGKSRWAPSDCPRAGRGGAFAVSLFCPHSLCLGPTAQCLQKSGTEHRGIRVQTALSWHRAGRN